MFKILLGAIFKIRDIFQSKFGAMFERFRDPSTGKITFAKPKTLRKIIMIVSFLVFFLIFFSKLIGSKNAVTGGVDNYERELNPTTGVGVRDVRTGGSEEDMFKGLGNISRDQYGNPIDRNRTDISGGGDDGVGGLSVQECATVIDKLKENQTLSTEEQDLAKSCLEQNVLGLTADELGFANAMLDPNTSAAEKALLAKALAGTATPEELAVAKALSSGSDAEKALARAAVAAGDEAINALGKSLDGRPLSAEEQAALDRLKAQVAAGENVAKAPPTIDGASVDLSGTPEALKAASQTIAANEEVIKRLEEELANAQLQVSPISEKLAAGRGTTEAENKLLQQFTQRRTELDNLKKAQEGRKTDFATKVTRAQTNLAQAVTTVQSSLPSGSFIEYEGEAFDCSKVKPLPYKKRPKKVTVAKKEKVLDLDGRELRPEEVEFIKLQRKKMYELSQSRKDAINPLGAESLGTAVNLNQLAGDGQVTGIQDLQSLVVFKDAGLKNFELTPDMKIPAVLDSQILVSDKGKGQIVRVRIIDDIHNPATNEIVVPKGSIATGMTSGFDAETGIMDLTFDRVTVGSGKNLTVRLAVGSADGSMGLKGEIRDTTGKYLLGAFITSFSAGALGYFSQQVIAPYQQSTVAGTALQGAGLAGAADVMTKIAELYSGKLQNAAVIYWVPRGIPIVLYPN